MSSLTDEQLKNEHFIQKEITKQKEFDLMIQQEITKQKELDFKITYIKKKDKEKAEDNDLGKEKAEDNDLGEEKVEDNDLGEEKVNISEEENPKNKTMPSYEQLTNDLEEMSYLQVGKKYGKSVITIRKWINKYEKNNHFQDFYNGALYYDINNEEYLHIDTIYMRYNRWFKNYFDKGNQKKNKKELETFLNDKFSELPQGKKTLGYRGLELKYDENQLRDFFNDELYYTNEEVYLSIFTIFTKYREWVACKFPNANMKTGALDCVAQSRKNLGEYLDDRYGVMVDGRGYRGLQLRRPQYNTLDEDEDELSLLHKT